MNNQNKPKTKVIFTCCHGLHEVFEVFLLCSVMSKKGQGKPTYDPPLYPHTKLHIP